MAKALEARSIYAPSDMDSETDNFEDALSVRSLTHKNPSTSNMRTTQTLSKTEEEDEDSSTSGGLEDNAGHDNEAGDDEDDDEEEEKTDKGTLTSAHTSPISSPGTSKRSSTASSIDSKDKLQFAMGQPDLALAIPMPVPTAVVNVTSPVGNRPTTPMVPIFDHSLNNGANLDNVSLDDDAGPTVPAKDAHGANATAGSKEAAAVPQPPPKDSSTASKSHGSKSLSLSTLTSAFPSLPWSPAASDNSGKSLNQNSNPSPNASPKTTKTTSTTNTTSSSTTITPTPPARRLTSPFSWLSRSSSRERDSAPPMSSAKDTRGRRNTGGSVATLNSNNDTMLDRLDEENDSDDEVRNPHRASLKDRFKALRLKEESGALDGEDPSGQGTLSPISATTAADDPETPVDRSIHTPLVSNPNPSLAPGTVSGISAGPSDMSSSEVDWDLWQNVVYEGPAAVARSSAEELNVAIAKGIPHAIRGVIWQVLAQSKNEDLELKYRELVNRGTEKENKDRSSSGTALSSASSSLPMVAEKTDSSASSVRSSSSTTKDVATPSTAATEKNEELSVKALAAAAAEKTRKQKEDAVTLQKLEKVIRRDMGARTSYSKYAAAQGLQEGLFGVCKAYALFDEAVSYAQGMNFIIMPLLFNMPEDEAFCLLVRLMNHYQLRDLFIQDMPGLHMRLYQFERLLEDFEPALYCHLHRRGISPHLYATQWFLTLFAYRFPLQLVLRIYDLILSEGLSAILRFGLVLMQKNTPALLAMNDMQQLTTFLRDKLFDVYIDKDPSAGGILENGFFGSSSSSQDKEVYRADQLVRDACDIKMTPELLKTYTTEWEEQTKAKKERENELENLRTSNASLTIRLRKMEERLEACDGEQTAMANELVHTKVENEELRDENEGLRGQVRELRIVIEHQPEEIEKTWTLERDDLMKRNLKVHEENQKLEAELATLEEELVQTKLKYAEINSQHETLNRKWTDLKRQFA
ncbi:GTPase-activating protein GYP5 [Ceratocystis lukuohia]|uniref:GTPase-activating protein GYP5 n=1 Tax=Ceratocystis lukuohia TaxID=2019550 RepID=A0ABR4MFE7_9PEZI